VSLLLLYVPTVVPWRENGPSPTDRVEHVAACFTPPRRHRRLCADHRVEPYTCRCRCRRPRAHPARPPLFVPVVVRSPRYVVSTGRSRPRREHRPPCARLLVHKPNQVTILLPFRRRAHAGQGVALAHVPVGTRMPSSRKVKAFLLGFVPQRKPVHAPMLEDRRADDVLSHRGPSTLIAERAVSQTGKLEP
jgi:hypothetical protein